MKPGRHAVLVQCDPVIGQALGDRVLAEQHPADAPHGPDREEVGAPVFDGAERLDEGLRDLRGRRRPWIGAIGPEPREVVLVQDRAVIFETRRGQGGVLGRSPDR